MLNLWANFIGYQVVWFIAVIYAGRGQPWPGAVAAVVFVTWQVLVASSPRGLLKVIGVAAICGIVVDGMLAATGMANYAAAVPGVPTGGAPLWIVELWISFATTLSGSLRSLQTRPWLAAVVALLGAPLAYLGAERGWHAVDFQAPRWVAIAALAVGWGIAFPLLCVLSRRWSPPVNPASAP